MVFVDKVFHLLLRVQKINLYLPHFALPVFFIFCKIKGVFIVNFFVV